MRHHHRPAVVPPAWLDDLVSGPDPMEVAEAAHRTAAVVVGRGRANEDPEVRARLIGLVEELGLATVAGLWADRPARTLPGALWRLYLLNEWVARQGDEVGRAYMAGAVHAEVYRVIAGVVEPPQPEDLRWLTGIILAGVFEGDLAIALERAAAFCHVMAVGLGGTDAVTPPEEPADGVMDDHTATQARRAARLQVTAQDLQAAARLWRAGELS